MFFLASAKIVDRHVELREHVQALDSYLHANDGHTFRLGHAARILRFDTDLVLRLLEIYRAEGAVIQKVAYICSNCDGFLERVAGEGDLWCDICEESFSYRGRGNLGEKAWQTLPDAPRTEFESSVGASPENVSAGGPTADRVVVQFVAGDRGGSLTPQVKLPREHKAINDSIRLGAYRMHFESAPPIFAASISDIINCLQHHPTIVHFSGHGVERRLVLIEDRDILSEHHELPLEQVGLLFENFPTRVRLVFFNTCLSLPLARHLVERDVVDMAIGIKGKIADDHAIAFATDFYRQLADGQSVQRAFNLALLHLHKTEISERPQLLCSKGTDATIEIMARSRATD